MSLYNASVVGWSIYVCTRRDDAATAQPATKLRQTSPTLILSFLPPPPLPPSTMKKNRHLYSSLEAMEAVTNSMAGEFFSRNPDPGPASTINKVARYANPINDFFAKSLYPLLDSPDAFEAEVKNQGLRDETLAMVKGIIWKQRGTALFKEGKYEEAIHAYTSSIRYTAGKDVTYPLPSPTSVNKEIANLDTKPYVDVVACANNIAFCYVKLQKYSEALEWLEEVHCYYEWWSEIKLPPALAFGEFTLLFDATRHSSGV